MTTIASAITRANYTKIEKGSVSSLEARLDRLAAEEIDQLDDENDHHHQLEHKGAALVKLVDHETVEIFSGVKLFLHQILVVGHAYFLRRQFVQAGREHVAEKLDGIF